MNPTRLVVDQDVPDGRETILRLLLDYNLRNAPSPNNQLLGILLKDDAGRTIGGLWGASRYEWLFVDMLFVPDELRGQGLGTSLLRQAEEIARARNCMESGSTPSTFRLCPSTRSSATPSSVSSKIIRAASRSIGSSAVSTRSRTNQLQSPHETSPTHRNPRQIRRRSWRLSRYRRHRLRSRGHWRSRHRQDRHRQTQAKTWPVRKASRRRAHGRSPHRPQPHRRVGAAHRHKDKARLAPGF